MLITGGSGALGIELKKVFPDSKTPDHSLLDITKKNEVSDFFGKNDIDVIIHAAALTNVRLCEENKELALRINVEGTKNLVEEVIKSNKKIKFVYISTACVFDGHFGMFKESSIPYPENFYALTKLIAEYEVTKLPSFLIIRTNFVPKEKWPYPKAFTDRFGTYLFSQDVARGISDVIKEGLEGIVHIVGDKKISMYDLAKITTPNIEPMTMKDYSGPRLTMDMSLDTEKWKKYKISD
jgi:dTDP-4-dehydrorhamnose reductase